MLAGAFLGALGASARSDEKPGEMVENPYHKFWGGFKEGSTVVHTETTKLSHPDSKQWTPDGVDEKRIAYKLVEANDKRVVVEMVVTEKEFLGFVQAAPTRYIYPAQVRKQDLARFIQETGAKPGEDKLKILDKEMKVNTLSGTIKGAGGEETAYTIWLCDEVPGRVVKKVRTTRQKGEVIAETTVTLVSFKKAE